MYKLKLQKECALVACFHSKNIFVVLFFHQFAIAICHAFAIFLLYFSPFSSYFQFVKAKKRNRINNNQVRRIGNK